MSTERERRQSRPRLAPARGSERRACLDESINKLYVMANESYEDFARGLQTEYESEGVSFGKVPLAALSKLTQVVDDEERPIGREAARKFGQP